MTGLVGGWGNGSMSGWVGEWVGEWVGWWVNVWVSERMCGCWRVGEWVDG